MIRTRRHRCRSPTSRPSLWHPWYQTLSCRFSIQRSLASKCHHHKLTLYVGYNGHDQVLWIRCMILACPRLLRQWQHMPWFWLRSFEDSVQKLHCGTIVNIPYFVPNCTLLEAISSHNLLWNIVPFNSLVWNCFHCQQPQE